MTGEQTIAQSTNWTLITDAADGIILQNQSQVNAVYYYVGDTPPSTQTGVILRALSEHTPNIKSTENLYIRSTKSDVTIAWCQ